MSLDKGNYSWTDKVKIRLMVHGFDHKQDTIQISVGDNELKSYKLSKAGNGLYTGEVILTGFSHDVDGDGKSDTNPRTTGNGPNNGFLESFRGEDLEVSIRLQDGTKIKTTTKITWNVGEISFDMSNHQFDDPATLRAIDPDMNLNPESIDTLPIHVFSDSDKAGILVDAIETEETSGVFETTVSFTQNSVSSGNRLFAISGDTIYAQYTDHTLPKPYEIDADLEITAESIVQEVSSEYNVGQIQWLRASYPSSGTGVVRIIDPDMNLNSEKIDNFDIFMWSDSNTKGYSPTATETDASSGIFESTIFFSLSDESSGPRLKVEEGDIITAEYEDSTLPESYTEDVLRIIAKSEIRSILESPLKQFKSGIPIGEIQCRENLTLIQKHDGSPVCVKYESRSKLMERSWSESELEPIVPDTGEFRYGEQECSYVDNAGESNSCIISGWTKSVSELDCEQICARPGTKE